MSEVTAITVAVISPTKGFKMGFFKDILAQALLLLH
jgi:hypothetical protein